MSESIKNKKQTRQKPPLSLVRTACEIIAGVVAGFAVPVPVFYAVYYLVFRVALGAPADWAQKDCGLGGLLVLAILFMSFPPAYISGTIIGVYFVGTRGKQTGSFLATLGGVFLGVPIAALLLFYIWAAEEYTTLGIEKVIMWPLVFLAPPSGATLAFNLTRRYQKPPSS